MPPVPVTRCLAYLDAESCCWVLGERQDHDWHLVQWPTGLQELQPWDLQVFWPSQGAGHLALSPSKAILASFPFGFLVSFPSSGRERVNPGENLAVCL